MSRQPLRGRRSRRLVLRVERLEDRYLLAGDIQIQLDPVFDQFGYHAETTQVYEDKVSLGSIFDTGASVVTFSATDQFVFDPFEGGTGIPIKVVGGAQAEGIGGILTGDVSQPGTILVDGFHTNIFSGDIFGDFGGGTYFDQLQGRGSVVNSTVASSLVGDDRLNLEDNVYNNFSLLFTSTNTASAANLGQSRTITDYDGTSRTFSFSSDFPALPVSGDTFHIIVGQGTTAGGLPARDRLSATPTGLGLSGTTGEYVGRYLLFTSGELAGKSQLITEYDGPTQTFKLALPFAKRPQIGDTFDIIVGTASSVAMPGVQAFVGTFTGSSILPTIAGTPLLNPTTPFPVGSTVPNPITGPQPLHPNGLALEVDPQGLLLDLGELLGDLFPNGLFDGIILPNPSVRFREPGALLEVTESFHAETTVVDPTPAASQFLGSTDLVDFADFYIGFHLRFLTGNLAGEIQQITAYDATTRQLTFGTPFSQAPANGDFFELVRISSDPVTLDLDFVGFDNHDDPGDSITVSYNPISSQVKIAEDAGGGEIALDNQVFLFDTGAQLSTITEDQALSLGFNLDAPEFTTSVQGAAGVVADLPGFTLDELSLPTMEGGRLTFFDVPVFVIDVAEEIQGIMGMNLFNNAGQFLYDPFSPSGPTLQATFYSQRAEVVPEEIDTSQLDPLEALLLQTVADVLPLAFSGAVGLREITLPNFGMGVDLDLTPQSGVVTDENGVMVVTVSPGSTVDFTAVVPYAADFYDLFQIDFASTNPALTLTGWATDAAWTNTTDGTLVYPGDSAIGVNGNSALSATLGTFVVNTPTAPGDYLLSAANNNTFFQSAGTTDKLSIRDFGDIVIRVQDTPKLTISNASIVEGPSGTATDIQFQVTLTGDATGPVFVTYATADGTATSAGNDYASATDTLQFALGETQKTISIPVTGDALPEANESFVVNLSNATMLPNSIDLMPLSDATGVDNDGDLNFDFLETAPSDVQLTADGGFLAPPLRAFAMEFDLSAIPAGTVISSATLTLVETIDTVSSIDVHGYVGNGDNQVTTAHPFNIPLDNKLGSVGLVAGVGTESLDVTSFIQSFAAGALAGFYLQTNDLFGAEQYAIHSSEALNPENRPKLVIDFSPVIIPFTNGQGTGTIRNDDTLVSISNSQQTELDSGQNEAAFVVQLTHPSALEVTANYVTSNVTAMAGSDYQSVNGTVAFAPGQTVKTITVPVLGDTVPEPTETFQVGLSNPTNASVSVGQGVGTVIDNDPQPNLVGWWTQLSSGLAAFGNTVTLEHFLVKNTGAAASGAFQVKFYLSNDNVGDAGDLELIINGTGSSILNVTSTASGAFSPDQVITLDLPGSGADGNYFIIPRLDWNDTVAESNEADNWGQPGDLGLTWGHDSISLVSTAQANLTGWWTQLSSDLAAFGGTVALEHFIAKNTGASASGAFQVKFYLSNDNVGDAGDLELIINGTGSSILNMSSIGAGAYSTDQVITLDLPGSGTDGNYFIIPRLDWNDTVAESNEADNWGQPGDLGLTWGHDSISLVSTAQANLTGWWTQLSSDLAAFGGTVTLEHFIAQNTGATASGAFQVKFFLSTDNVGDVGDTELIISGTGSSILTVNGIASGAFSTDQAITLDLPGSGTAGNYFIIPHIDWNESVAESNEADNWGQLGDLGLTWGHDSLSLITSAQANLTGWWTQLSSDLGAFGNTVTLEHFIAKNTGATASGAFQVKFFLSTDNVGDVGDTELIINGTASSILNVTSIAAGAYSTDQVITLDLPGSGTAGNYFIIPRLDWNGTVAESNEADNWGQPGDFGLTWGHDSISLVSTAQANLTGWWTQLSSDLAAFGGTVTLEHFIAKNTGASASGAFQVKFYLSTDNVGNAGDTELIINGTGSSILNMTSIAAGAYSTDQVITLDLPGSGSAGNYFIIPRIDWNDTVTESNEADNWGQPGDLGLTWGHDSISLISSAQANLTGWWTQLSSDLAAFGGTVALDHFIAQNTGATASGAFQVKFYLSNDNVGDAGDLELIINGTGSSILNMSSIGAGAYSTDQVITLDLPGSGTDGNYFIIPRLDWNDTIAESNEADNWGQPGDLGPTWGHDSISLVSSAQANLTGWWTQLSSDSGTFGNTVTLEHWIVKNTGAAASGAFEVKFYLSTDNVGDVGDTELIINGTASSILNASSIAAGAYSTNQAITLDLPGGGTAGNYFIIPRIDSNSTVVESNEDDNWGAPGDLGLTWGHDSIFIESPLLLADPPASDDSACTPLADSQLNQIVEAAIEIWAGRGITESDLQALRNVNYTIQNLGGSYLGLAGVNTIQIDDDAGGYGWFVDATPLENEEFVLGQDGLIALAESAASGQVDLLTVVLHEMGHVLGLNDNHDDPADELMGGWLALGVRRLPTEAEIAQLLYITGKN